MAGLDWTADDRAFTYHGGALEVARRLAPKAPPSPGSISRRGLIRTPIRCPLLTLKPGRACPRAERWRNSRPLRRCVTASARKAWSQGPARGRSSTPWPTLCRAARSARWGELTAVSRPPSPPQALALSRCIDWRTWATSASPSRSTRTTQMHGSFRVSTSWR
jgi:hypothetical protein